MRSDVMADLRPLFPLSVSLTLSVSLCLCLFSLTLTSSGKRSSSTRSKPSRKRYTCMAMAVWAASDAASHGELPDSEVPRVGPMVLPSSPAVDVRITHHPTHGRPPVLLPASLPPARPPARAPGAQGCDDAACLGGRQGQAPRRHPRRAVSPDGEDKPRGGGQERAMKLVSRLARLQWMEDSHRQVNGHAWERRRTTL